MKSLRRIFQNNREQKQANRQEARGSEALGVLGIIAAPFIFAMDMVLFAVEAVMMIFEMILELLPFIIIGGLFAGGIYLSSGGSLEELTEKLG